MGRTDAQCLGGTAENERLLIAPRGLAGTCMICHRECHWKPSPLGLGSTLHVRLWEFTAEFPELYGDHCPVYANSVT
ncbi:hypothetical protein RRG08_019555 [Elysia crispata]|uniref:Uncharacterized protein n=1 Tax=Elysia crispata TaxID=231223 RepID=A0AAE0YX41_9GAST|nr:hypothetical protein RRG08_019555 [Elysia crispata]